MLSILEKINTVMNHFIWGPVMLSAFLLIGLIFSLRSHFFQLFHIKYWLQSTLGNVLTKKKEKGNSSSITPFQALCTALAATVGTGNIAGVATAITLGGPGSVFWMWLSAFLGMMTSFAEKSLGMQYRYKNAEGEWIGGPMVYIEKGLHCKPLACLFCIFCIFASLGMGNMVQVNTISDCVKNTFHFASYKTGILLVFLVSLVILGGIQRIASISEKIVPFMSVLYILGGLLVIFYHYEQILPALFSIFSEAFCIRSAGSGILGYGILQAMRVGISRGVFSNEAGLGSSVLVHAKAENTSPMAQGMWGICEVFIDTIVLCTITALVILTSGVYNAEQCLSDMAHGIPVLTGAPLTSAAFCTVFSYGDVFLTCSIILFAFATILGWCFFGECAVTYLFGKKAILPYKMIFLCFIFLGSIASLEFVWNISDTFNGLMAIPNLIALILLSRKVKFR